MAIGEKRQTGRLVHSGVYQEQILAEQVQQIYGLAPLGLLGTVINSLIVFFVMQEVMRPGLLVPWIAAVLTITALRLGLVIWFRSTDPEAIAAAAWARRFLVSAAVAGLAWGAIVFFPFTGISLAHQVFLAFVLGGMAAGASSMYSMLRLGFPAFSIPALLPLTVHFFLIEDPFHFAMGLMTMLFGVLLWRISQHNHKINSISLRLRYENLEMISSLKETYEQVEGLNAQLLAEIEARHRAEADLLAQHGLLERTVAERTRELVRTNEQLLEAKQASEAANQAKSEFLVNMSHEMRTPLAGTLGMIHLVLETDIGEETRRLLQMACRSADSLLRIISDVLDFSRLEAGVMRFEEEEFPVHEVVRTALEVVALTAVEKGLDLTWQIEDVVPERLVGDQGRLRQVLVNLLGNSVKFTEAGRIEIVVTLAGEENDGQDDSDRRRSVLFQVRDTGVGIPAVELEKIFDRFTQVDSSLSRRYGGTGLGLALTRQIVQKWGGRAWAESRVGEGSIFYFTFPVR